MARTSVEGRQVIPRDFQRRYLVAERAEGVYVWDEEGKRYLDGSAGSSAVVSIGHGVAEIASVMAEQALSLAYAPMHMFTHRPIWALAEAIAEMAPGSLNCTWFVSGGSEATENAVKLARQYQQERGAATRFQVITRWSSFHGNTFGAMGYSGHTFRRRRYVPMLQNQPHIPPAYRYRCDYCQEKPGCTLQCANALEKEIRRQGQENVAAFIAEPVVGATLGAVPAPDGYFQRIREICDKYGVVFISDEVMTGFGRTGTSFGIDHWGVVPDLIATAKGVSGGYTPLGAVIATDEIVETLARNDANFVAGHTYTGNPLSAAVGLAVLQYMHKHALIENSRVQGERLLQGLEKVMAHHPIVGDVRGKGLMVGLEFVRDRLTKEPFPVGMGIANRIGQAALDRGLISYPLQGCVDGVEGDMLKFTPPMTITADQVDELLATLDEAIGVVEREL